MPERTIDVTELKFPKPHNLGLIILLLIILIIGWGTFVIRDGLGSLDSRGRVLSGGPPSFTSLLLPWAACSNKLHQAFYCQVLGDAAVCCIDQTIV